MHHDDSFSWGWGMGFGHGFIGLIFWIIIIAVVIYLLKDIFGRK